MARTLIEALGDAIARQEGYLVAGSRAQRNNNPGNIWDGLGKGKTKRIWPELPIDDKGYIIYPTPEAGRAALERQLQIKINRGEDLLSLITAWAPPTENDTVTYLRNVSQWLGIPTDKPLNQLARTWTPSPAAPAPRSAPNTSPPCGPSRNTPAGKGPSGGTGC